MDFNKYRNKTWEDLTDKEKQEWEEFTQIKSDKLLTWKVLTDIHIGKGKKKTYLIKKMPYDTETPLSSRINWDFFVKYYQQEGVPPSMIMEKIKPIFEELGVIIPDDVMKSLEEFDKKSKLD